MIKLLQQSKASYPSADYVFTDTDKIDEILGVLTPKFTGVWEILILDPSIKFINDFLKVETPDFINITIYLPAAKLDVVVADYPKLAPKKQSVWDLYQEAIARLPVLMERKVVIDLYKSIGPNIEELQKALNRLSAEADGSITRKQVKIAYPNQKRIYASQVLEAFLSRNFNRWKLANNYILNLGEEIAYYALYKQVRNALQDKNDYLHNKQITNKIAVTYDAPLLCYCYCCFANSSSFYNLYALLTAIDKRCEETLNAIKGE